MLDRSGDDHRLWSAARPNAAGGPLIWESPLRTGNLRDPNGPHVTFAQESLIDELAAAAKADPVEFRVKLLTAETKDDNAFRRARSIAAIANAIHDATGVRIRRVPLRKERVLAALKAAQVV